MSIKTKVTICEEEVQQFCNQLIHRSRDIVKTHESLVTIEALFSRFSQNADSPEVFKSILHSVREFTNDTRTTLMQQYADKLGDALRKSDKSGIREVYAPLSRNGFNQILQKVVDDLSDEQCLAINYWCLKWLTQARREAEEASGYPDSYDFKKAGVDLELYYAFDDINRYLINR